MVQKVFLQVLGTTEKGTMCLVIQSSYWYRIIDIAGHKSAYQTRGPPVIGVRLVVNDISMGMVNKM